MNNGYGLKCVLFLSALQFYFSIMSGNAIDLKAAVAIMRSGAWFSCAVVQCDLTRKTAGKILQLPKVRIARLNTMMQSGAAIAGHTGFKKSAAHNENFTLNLELPNQQIKKIHPALVFRINNQPVL